MSIGSIPKAETTFGSDAPQTKVQASAAPVDGQAPLVLSVDASGGPRIAALNAAAEQAGLAIGDRLADARARVEDLQIRPADPQADDAALRRLALWCTRYTPTVSLWGEPEGADGLFLDITGSAHLFGGEEALIADLAARLHRFDVPARLALAGTRGASWALARFGGRRMTILASGEEERALHGLPVEALRLPAPVQARLRRLGFKRIGDVVSQPRAPFTARFGAILTLRLDQALGRTPEPVTPVTPPAAYRATRQLIEPIGTQDAIVAVTTRLMEDLSPALERDGIGARTLQLRLHRVDGEVASVTIELAEPTRDARHVGRLTRLKLESPAGAPDAGHGFEILELHVLAAEPMAARQLALSAPAEDERGKRLTSLIDVLRQRFGASSVGRLDARESHVPERAVSAGPYGVDAPAWPSEPSSLIRPLLLLAPAEPAEVIAAGIDEPPCRFRWRGILHDVTQTQGPERIAPEWWRGRARDLTRDYYVVEDCAGRRFWMYRVNPNPDDRHPGRSGAESRDRVTRMAPAGVIPAEAERRAGTARPEERLFRKTVPGLAPLSRRSRPDDDVEMPASRWFVHGLFA